VQIVPDRPPCHYFHGRFFNLSV